jgi:hypothetical protein
MTKTRDLKKNQCKMIAIFVVKSDFSFLRIIQFCMHSVSFGLLAHVILIDMNTDKTPFNELNKVTRRICSIDDTVTLKHAVNRYNISDEL